MKLLQLKCPTCGAKLEVSDQLKSFTCNYCGQTTMLDDEIIKVEHKIIGNDKNEAFQRVEAFFKLKYYDQAEKLSFELTDKYPYDSQAWLYLIKAYTKDFTVSPSDEILNNLEEYFKNYTVFEQDEINLAKNKKKYEEYLASFKSDESDFEIDSFVKTAESSIDLECPYCLEKIKYGDKKCKSCGEELYWPEEK